MNRIITVAALALLITMPCTVARAQADDPAAPTPTERLQEGAAAIIDGLRLLMDQLQSYQAPEVLPNGDIIIRRQPPVDAPPQPPKPAEPKSDTSKPQPL